MNYDNAFNVLGAECDSRPAGRLLSTIGLVASLICVDAMSAMTSRRDSEQTGLEVFATWDVPRCTLIFAEFRELSLKPQRWGEDVLVIWHWTPEPTEGVACHSVETEIR